MDNLLGMLRGILLAVKNSFVAFIIISTKEMAARSGGSESDNQYCCITDLRTYTHISVVFGAFRHVGIGLHVVCMPEKQNNN